MLNSTELPRQAAQTPLLQPEAGDLGDAPVPGMEPHHTTPPHPTGSRSGAALLHALPSCLCSMEVAAWQTELASCSSRSQTSETQSTTPRRNEPLGEQQGLPTPDSAREGRGGAAHRATGTTLPRSPTFSAHASPWLQHIPSQTREGPSSLVASGHWEPEGDRGAADDKNPSCGISSFFFPRRKENHQGNTQRSTVYPDFQSWAGPWEAECPRATLAQDTPQDWVQGADCFIPIYGEQKDIKGIYTTLRRVRSKQTEDFNSYEINVADGQELQSSKVWVEITQNAEAAQAGCSASPRPAQHQLNKRLVLKLTSTNIDLPADSNLSHLARAEPPHILPSYRGTGWMDGLKGGSSSPAALPMKCSSITL